MTGFTFPESKHASNGTAVIKLSVESYLLVSHLIFLLQVTVVKDANNDGSLKWFFTKDNGPYEVRELFFSLVAGEKLIII